MVDYLQLVKEFHEKYGHFINTEGPFAELPYAVYNLRRKLITEEVNEFIGAINAVDAADAIADLLYVTFGAALAYGIPIEEVFKEVHRSNMTKSTEKDENGKTIKGNYSPADIKSILENHKNDDNN